MRRWNGWGDEADDTHVGASPRHFLEQTLGLATAPRDATLAEVVAGVPPSRLDPVDGLLDIDPELRVRRARGQSFPDLIALRSGRLGAVPDAVARPLANEVVRRLIDHAKATGARLIPYGGGTSVVGGVSARPSADPLITVDLGGLNRRPRPRRTERPRDRRRRDHRTGPRLLPRRSRPDDRPRTPVLGAGQRRRLGCGAGLRPAVLRLGADRAAVRGWHAGGSRRDPRHAPVPCLGSRSRPAPARARLRGSARHPDRRDPAHQPTARGGPPGGVCAPGLGGRPRVRARHRPGPHRAQRPAPLDPRREPDAPGVCRPADADPGPHDLPAGPPPAEGLGAAPGRGGRPQAPREGRAGGGPRRSSAPTEAPRSPPSRRRGRRPASARRTCATRCGRSATARTRSRPPRTGRASRRSLPGSRPPSAMPSRPWARGSTCSPISRTCTRRARAST